MTLADIHEMNEVTFALIDAPHKQANDIVARDFAESLFNQRQTHDNVIEITLDDYNLLNAVSHFVDEDDTMYFAVSLSAERHLSFVCEASYDSATNEPLSVGVIFCVEFNTLERALSYAEQQFRIDCSFNSEAFNEFAAMRSTAELQLDNVDALSERYTALLMQDVLVEVCACTKDAQDYHVAVVKYLRQKTHDVADAQQQERCETDVYRFEEFEHVKQFLNVCNTIVFNDAA